MKGSATEPVGVVKRIQEIFKAELHLLRVVGEDDKAEKEGWLQAMERFMETNGLEGAEKHIEENEDVEEGILNFARRENMGLIAMGSHGYHGWKHLFHHSVSEDVVDHLPFPVLTYRIGEEE